MSEISGNKKGIKDTVLEEIEKLYEIKVPQDQIITEELAAELAKISEKIKREISIYVTRSGQITDMKNISARNMGHFLYLKRKKLILPIWLLL
jgi:GTP-binding protein HflX